MKRIVYSCDFPQCKEERTPTNHWFMMSTETHKVIVEPFNEETADGKQIFCGQVHTTQYLDRILSSTKK